MTSQSVPLRLPLQHKLSCYYNLWKINGRTSILSKPLTCMVYVHLFHQLANLQNVIVGCLI